jgi:hypothetical protein
MLFQNSYRPLNKVKIVCKETVMRSAVSPHGGSAEPIVLYNAYRYAICDGVEKLDTRLTVMFDLDETNLRRRCDNEGLVIVD